MGIKLREIAEASEKDPKQALLSALPSKIRDIEVFHNQVLVATYIAPEKTKGGVYRPVNAILEDRFQGKVGLVIAKGPTAFVDTIHVTFANVDVQIGDWIAYRSSDGFEIGVMDDGGRDWVACRLLEDVHIRARVSDPALVY